MNGDGLGEFVGTRDFYQDAAEALQASDTPHVLLCGFDGSVWRYRSINVTNLTSLRWFRDAVNELIDETEERLLKGEDT